MQIYIIHVKGGYILPSVAFGFVCVASFSQRNVGKS